MNKTILACVAHADDLEVYCGGSMAKFIGQGYRGVEVLLTACMGGAAAGDKGYRQTRPAEAIPIRDAELRHGAEILGIETIERLEYQNTLYSNGEGFVWMGDEGYAYAHPAAQGPLLPAVGINEKLLEPLVKLFCRYEPEIVIGQHMFSGFEHLASGHIINLAFRKALAQGADLGQLWLPVTARHCSWASDLRIYPSPNILIDITDTWEKKQEAMLAHASQQLENAIARIRLTNAYWGIARECELAEAFFTLCEGRYR